MAAGRATAPAVWTARGCWFLSQQQSAPEGIRTPNLLIRSQMLYPLSYGRRCCPEVPCGIAQSNDGQDYRLIPAPTKSVCRVRRATSRHTSRRAGGDQTKRASARRPVDGYAT
jgi:hypothetical protein